MFTAEMQKQQKEWVAHNFPNRESWMPILGLTEECAELVQLDPKSNHIPFIIEALGRLNHGHLKRAQNIRINEDHKARIKDAVADLTIFLSDYCNAEEIDYEKTVQEVWSQVYLRDFKKFPKNGLTE